MPCTCTCILVLTDLIILHFFSFPNGNDRCLWNKRLVKYRNDKQALDY